MCSAATSSSSARAKCSSPIGPPDGRKIRSTSVSLVVGLSSHPSGRPLGLHARLDERLERALGVLLAHEEVDVVLGGRAAARPAGEAAAEQEGDAGVAQRRGRDLHRIDQLGRSSVTLASARAAAYPARRLRKLIGRVMGGP